jgi:peptidoglycan/LPS O-acetylase OafA/YrhL
MRSDKLRRWQCVSWPAYLFGAIALLLLLYIHVSAIKVLGRIISPPVADVITYPFFILFIPCLFLVFGKSPFDRHMGELSYPIYLVYDFVIVIVAQSPALDVGANLGRLDAMLSILVAMFIYRLVIKPIDRKRHALSRNSANSQTSGITIGI